MTRKSLFTVLALAVMAFSACGSDGGDCDIDYTPFMNGADADHDDSAWVCASDDIDPFLFQIFEDGTGISSEIGAFTWEESGCGEFAVEGALDQTISNIDGSVASGIGSFDITFEDGDTASVGCELLDE